MNRIGVPPAFERAAMLAGVTPRYLVALHPDNVTPEVRDTIKWSPFHELKEDAFVPNDKAYIIDRLAFTP